MWLRFLWVEALSAGSSPRRATYFSLLRQRKVGKRKAAPLAVALRATCDARARGGAAELALFASLSPLKQRQRVSSRSAHASLRARPTPCASRHGQKGVKSTRAIAALGPVDENSSQIGRQRLSDKRQQLPNSKQLGDQAGGGAEQQRGGQRNEPLAPEQPEPEIAR